MHVRVRVRVRRVRVNVRVRAVWAWVNTGERDDKCAVGLDSTVRNDDANKGVYSRQLHAVETTASWNFEGARSNPGKVYIGTTYTYDDACDTARLIPWL